MIQDTFKNSENELILKDNASRILLTQAIKKNLEKKYQQSEKIFETVTNHCSTSFNLEKELKQAQAIVLNNHTSFDKRI